jgi:outer membrane protein
MRRLTGAPIAAVLLTVLGAAPSPAQGPAQAPRLAYINSQYILANTPGRAQAESAFAREMVAFRAEVQRLQQQLDSAVSEYQRTSLVMSPAARQQRENELRQMEQRTRQRAGELEEQAERREQELTAPIMQRVNAVIEGIRAEFNYAMIFDASAQGGSLVTADRALDISNLVIQRLRAGGEAPLPGGGPLRPAAADTSRPAATPPRAPPGDTTRPAPARPTRP